MKKLEKELANHEYGMEHNPMGGITGEVYINNDKHSYVTFILDTDSNGKLNKNHSISSYSSELNDKLLEADNNE